MVEVPEGHANLRQFLRIENLGNWKCGKLMILIR